jgi:Mg-chelatase subunit ChlD
MGLKARRGYAVCSVLVLALGLCAACGEYRTAVGGSCAQVSEALLIGITPYPGFDSEASAEHGLVEFRILPRDASGQAQLDLCIDVLLETLDPAISVEVEDIRVARPAPEKTLVAAMDIDSSFSMLETDPLRLRKDAAKQFVKELGSDFRVGVFDFGAGSTDGFSMTRMLSNFTGNVSRINRAIDRVTEHNQTPLYTSVVEVLAYLDKKFPRGSADRSLVLLSDGQPTDADSGTTHVQCCQQAKEVGAPINTVGFGPAADRSPSAKKEAVQVLRKLAICSGGSYTGVVKATNLRQAFERLGKAKLSGSLAVTARFESLPPSGSTIEGTLHVGNGMQAAVPLPFIFATP